MRNLIYALAFGHVLGLALLQGASARAEVIEQRLPSGIIASANFHAGNSQLPAVLFLHGFLQTSDFPTVNRLAESLHSSGYTTLTPTLSLGISRRAKSLPCEAAHRHTFEQDVDEISAWVNWLAKRHAGPIIFIGHSYGSLLGLVYVSSSPHPALQQLIALSLIDTERHPPNTSMPGLVNRAEALRAKRDKSLVDFALGHCKKFVATPESFLSYADWNRKRVLELARGTRVPVHVIIGSDDSRMGTGWTQALGAAGVRVDKIKGANHFFDAEYEFDLLDRVLDVLKSKNN